MKKLVFQDQAGSVIGRSWDEVPHKGESLSLISEHGGRVRYRVLDVDRFFSDVGNRSDLVYEPGEVMVTVARLGDA